MERPSRLHERHVERAAVVRSRGGCLVEDRGERVEHRALAGRDRSERTDARGSRRPRTSRSPRETRACRRRRSGPWSRCRRTRCGRPSRRLAPERGSNSASGARAMPPDNSSDAGARASDRASQTRSIATHVLASCARSPCRSSALGATSSGSSARSAASGAYVSSRPRGRSRRAPGERSRGGVMVRSSHDDQARRRRRGQQLQQPRARRLGQRPVAPSGPTHDGHPDPQGHPSISSRVVVSS